MKLEPRAKRVKIRITSGGEEHHNLDSLRKNFVCKDILPLLDGRLVKWLISIEESDKAEKISSLNISSENVMFEVYNILFSPQKKIHTLNDAIKASSSDEGIYRLVHDQIRQFDVSRFLSDGDKAHIFKEHPDIVLPLFVDFASGDISASKSSVVYNIGLILIKNRKEELGKICILEAAKKGYQDAVEYERKHYASTPEKAKEELEKICIPEAAKKGYQGAVEYEGKHYASTPEKASSLDIRALLKDKKVKDEIIFMWQNPGKRNNKSLSNFTPIESFITACNKIRREADTCDKFQYGDYHLYNTVKECFGNIDESDPLYLEKMFIRVVASKNNERDLDVLVKANYKPAVILYENHECLIDGLSFRYNDPLHNAIFLNGYIMNLDKYVK